MLIDGLFEAVSIILRSIKTWCGNEQELELLSNCEDMLKGLLRQIKYRRAKID